MQRKKITARDICVYLNGEITSYENGKESTIKNDAQCDQAKRVSIQLMWDDSEKSVAEAMTTLNLTDIPTKALVQAPFARQFTSNNSGWQVVNSDVVTEDMTAGDLFTMLTGKKPM